MGKVGYIYILTNKSLFKNISKGYKKFDTNDVKKSSLTVLDKPTEKKVQTPRGFEPSFIFL